MRKAWRLAIVLTVTCAMGPLPLNAQSSLDPKPTATPRPGSTPYKSQLLKPGSPMGTSTPKGSFGAGEGALDKGKTGPITYTGEVLYVAPGVILLRYYSRVIQIVRVPPSEKAVVGKKVRIKVRPGHVPSRFTAPDGTASILDTYTAEGPAE